MAMAYCHGVLLRDMECSIPPNWSTRHGYPDDGRLSARRYHRQIRTATVTYKITAWVLKPSGSAKEQHMELGPRDKVSQAFWHEQQKGTTSSTSCDVVHLDLRHLGEEYLQERLPFICELAKAYVNVDPAKEPIPTVPRFTTHGGMKPTNNVKLALKVCSRLVNVLLLVCTVQPSWF